MGIFDEPSTTPAESPAMTGQEEVGAEEQQEMQEEDVQETGQPESEQDAAQDAEDAPSEESEQGEEKPPFDYEKAYQELRKDYTRKAQKLADYERQQSPAQQPGQGQQTQVSREQVRQELEAQFEVDPVGTMLKVANAIADHRMGEYRQEVEGMVNPLYEREVHAEYNSNMEKLAGTYAELKSDEGYEVFLAALQNVAHEIGDPQKLLARPSVRLLKMAAQEAFGDKGDKLYQKAKAKGKEEALNTIRTKQGLAAPAGAKPKEQPKSIEDQIADSIVGAGRRNGIFG